jgi:hypothetical protein
MNRPARIAITLAFLGSAATAAAAFGASIPIYTNAMSSSPARSQLVHLGKTTCSRGAGSGVLNISVGKATRECQYRTPVIGTNLDVTVTARLLSSTPSSIQARTFVAVSLRNGDNGQYQLAVFPKKGSYQLRRDVPPKAARTLLAHGKASAVAAVGKPEKMRLQAFPTPDGSTRLTAFLNGKKLTTVVDDAHTAATLTGRFSTVSVGSDKAAKGAGASFDDLTVAVPDPFG